MSTCPCCGGPAPEGLRVVSQHRLVARRGQLLRLPGKLVALTELLRERPRTARDIARDLLGLTLARGEDAPSLVFVYVSQLRRALAPLEVRVELRGRRYVLVQD